MAKRTAPRGPWAEPLPAGADPRTHRFRFVGEVHPPMGAMIWNRVHFPWSVAELFGTKGRVRVVGSLARADATAEPRPFERALNPSREGHFVLISHDDLRALGVNVGELLVVELQHDARPLQFTEPEEVTAALNLEPELRAAFDALAPGKRRNLCHWVASAKRPETRAQRAADLLTKLVEG